MNVLKKITVFLLAISIIFCTAGCAQKQNEYEVYDNFKPASVLIVDCINGTKHETHIKDAKHADKMLNAFKELNINTNTEGEMGASYLYMRFYDVDRSTMLIFTIYDNGSCCLGEEFEDFYTVKDGRQKYIDLCELYEEYEAE